MCAVLARHFLVSLIVNDTQVGLHDLDVVGHILFVTRWQHHSGLNVTREMYASPTYLQFSMDIKENLNSYVMDHSFSFQ